MVREQDGSGSDAGADDGRPEAHGAGDAANAAEQATHPTDSTDSSGAHGHPSPADDHATEARILRILAGGMNLIGRVF